MAIVRRRDVFAARQQWANVAAKNGLAAHRDGVKRRAVKRIPHRNEFEPPGGDARELERQTNSRGASGSEQDAIAVARRELTQFFRQRDGRFARVTPRAERKCVELIFDRGDDSRMAEADLMHVVAVKIEVATSFDVLNPRVPAGFERVQARCGE